LEIVKEIRYYCIGLSEFPTQKLKFCFCLFEFESFFDFDKVLWLIFTKGYQANYVYHMEINVINNIPIFCTVKLSILYKEILYEFIILCMPPHLILLHLIILIMLYKGYNLCVDIFNQRILLKFRYSLQIFVSNCVSLSL
jgi:hypothetical protein